MVSKYKITVLNDGVKLQKRFLWFFYDSGLQKKWSDMTKEESKLCKKVIRDARN